MPLLKYPVSSEDHTLGAPDAKNQIVLYGDFQCPCSRTAAAIMRRILQEFGMLVSYTFRNFPVTGTHPYAFDAACAAEAAGRQGKYWEMHEAIFTNQGAISDDLFMNIAQDQGLSDGCFVAGTISKTVHNKINMDLTNGYKSGVTETPAFFLNGRYFEGSAEDLYKWIAGRAGDLEAANRPQPVPDQTIRISCPTSSFSAVQRTNFAG